MEVECVKFPFAKIVFWTALDSIIRSLEQFCQELFVLCDVVTFYDMKN